MLLLRRGKGSCTRFLAVMLLVGKLHVRDMALVNGAGVGLPWQRNYNTLAIP